MLWQETEPFKDLEKRVCLICVYHFMRLIWLKFEVQVAASLGLPGPGPAAFESGGLQCSKYCLELWISLGHGPAEVAEAWTCIMAGSDLDDWFSTMNILEMYTGIYCRPILLYIDYIDILENTGRDWTIKHKLEPCTHALTWEHWWFCQHLSEVSRSVRRKHQGSES